MPRETRASCRVCSADEHIYLLYILSPLSHRATSDQDHHSQGLGDVRVPCRNSRNWSWSWSCSWSRGVQLPLISHKDPQVGFRTSLQPRHHRLHSFDSFSLLYLHSSSIVDRPQDGSLTHGSQRHESRRYGPRRHGYGRREVQHECNRAIQPLPPLSLQASS